MSELNSLLSEYETEADTAKEWGVSTRTISHYRHQPDGLAWMELGGRVYVHKPSKKEFLARRTKGPNPVGRYRPRSKRSGDEAA